MVRPVRFGFNDQTAGSNAFQAGSQDENFLSVQQSALKEFDDFVSVLRKHHIDVTVYEDTMEPHTPDAVFPNNWISFHPSVCVLYPMLAPNRRNERRADIIAQQAAKRSLIDLSFYEEKSIFLEGTGSIVFDYKKNIAYANTSPRTDHSLLQELAKKLNARTMVFKAVDKQGKDIYHTNVLLTIGDRFAVLCKDAITEGKDEVVQLLEDTGHEIIFISQDQMNAFAGNMYQLFNNEGKSFIVMSEQAYRSLAPEQIQTLSSYGTILPIPLYTIEKYGGGSARCMIADIRN